MGPKIHDFDSAQWTGKHRWPKDLISISGSVIGAGCCPPAPGGAELPLRRSTTNFARVRIDIGTFLESWIKDRLPLAAEDKARNNELFDYQLIGLLSEVESSANVESELKFSLGAFVAAKVELSRTWDSLREQDLEDAWTRFLPFEICRGFIPVLGRPRPSVGELENAKRMVLRLLGSSKSSAVDSIRRSFERRFGDHHKVLECLYWLADEAWKRAHSALNASVRHLMSHEVFREFISQTTNPEATKSEVIFWYSTAHPWQSALSDRVLALRGTIPSLYAALADHEQDLFDHWAFELRTAPPLSIVKKMLKFAATYADNRAEVAIYDAIRHRLLRAEKGLPTKVGYMGTVPYEPGRHDLEGRRFKYPRSARRDSESFDC